MFSDRLSVFFLVLMLATAGYFLNWGLDYTQNNHVVLFALASVFGLYMAFNIGGNDVANAFGTSVGAGTLTIKQALLVAAIFEVAGAMIAGGAVTSTIRKGIVDLNVLMAGPGFNPMDFVYIMMAALLAAASWLRLATAMGWPVSTTHSIIGGIVGASIMLGGLAAGDQNALALVKWNKIGEIVASWVISPMLGGLCAFLLFWLIKHRILRRDDDESRQQQALEKYVPVLGAFGSAVITAMLLFKGLKQSEFNLTATNNALIILMLAAVAWMVLKFLVRTQREVEFDRSIFLLFSWMQVFTAAGFAFSHGSNDIANAIGPFAAILDVLRSGDIGSTAPVPPVAMFAFGIALVVGLWFIGKNVILTVGSHLTKMHPASGFAAELSAAAVVMLASILGIPVSSTHILVGAVLGIGVCNGHANWALMKPIGVAWVITLPVAGGMAALAFVVLRHLF